MIRIGKSLKCIMLSSRMRDSIDKSSFCLDCKRKGDWINGIFEEHIFIYKTPIFIQKPIV